MKITKLIEVDLGWWSGVGCPFLWGRVSILYHQKGRRFSGFSEARIPTGK